jgi:hypothetical protein
MNGKLAHDKILMSLVTEEVKIKTIINYYKILTKIAKLDNANVSGDL